MPLISTHTIVDETLSNIVLRKTPFVCEKGMKDAKRQKKGLNVFDVFLGWKYSIYDLQTFYDLGPILGTMTGFYT